jgi:hypothetical protein
MSHVWGNELGGALYSVETSRDTSIEFCNFTECRASIQAATGGGAAAYLRGANTGRIRYNTASWCRTMRAANGVFTSDWTDTAASVISSSVVIDCASYFCGNSMGSGGLIFDGCGFVRSSPYFKASSPATITASGCSFDAGVPGDEAQVTIDASCTEVPDLEGPATCFFAYPETGCAKASPCPPGTTWEESPLATLSERETATDSPFPTKSGLESVRESRGASASGSATPIASLAVSPLRTEIETEPASEHFGISSAPPPISSQAPPISSDWAPSGAANPRMGAAMQRVLPGGRHGKPGGVLAFLHGGLNADIFWMAAAMQRLDWGRHALHGGTSLRGGCRAFLHGGRHAKMPLHSIN